MAWDPNTNPKDGVWRGSLAQGAANIPAYETFVRHPMDYVTDYNARTAGWSGWENCNSLGSAWRNTPYRLVLAVAMWPTGLGNTLAAGAAGTYDAHWTNFGNSMVANGLDDAILRIGWEFNGLFYEWKAQGQEATFVTYWRRIVTLLRAVTGQHFQFDWCPLGCNNNANVPACYPGNNYVDYIGMDTYDDDPNTAHTDAERWTRMLNHAVGLNWHRDFAANNGKLRSCPEWGIKPVANGGFGDNPYYIHRMYGWLNGAVFLDGTSSGGVPYAYHSYFEGNDGTNHHRLMLGEFPLSRDQFLFDFGGPTGSTVPIGVATEDDTSQKFRIGLRINKADETDTSQLIKFIAPINKADETETAQPIVATANPIFKPIGLATEADLATPFGSIVPIKLATEVDESDQIFPVITLPPQPPSTFHPPPPFDDHLDAPSETIDMLT